MSIVAKTHKEQLRDIADAYRDAGQRWPASAMDMASWAYNNGLLKPHRRNMLKQFAREIAGALREEYYVDPQGRTVRTKHAAPGRVDGQQTMLWDDIRFAPPEHMERSLQLRRQQIVGDCLQLKKDQDSYNDNNPHGARLKQQNLNFEKDVAELETVEPSSAALRTKKPR